MRYGLYGGWTTVLAALAVAAPAAHGQGQPADTQPVPGLPGYTQVPNPLPTGNPGGHGFYTFASALFMTQTRTLGDQDIAVRGLLDTRGLVTGTPGTLIGSGAVALSTRDLPRQSWQPGFNVGVGFKLEDGTSVYASYGRLNKVRYHAGATLATPFARSGTDLADTFLTSPVYNFPPQYAGPSVKTTADLVQSVATNSDANGNNVTNQFIGTPGGNFYGIWNGSSVQDIEFDQWYSTAELAVRIPLFQTEYTRIFGYGGGRYVNFTDRFRWLVTSFDLNGVATSADSVRYTNTLYQRMYGAFVGCGHEAYLGAGFAVNVDLEAVAFLDDVRMRAKYKLLTNEIQNKTSRNEVRFVPGLNVNSNLLWHPIEGVQMRIGYSANTFYNTKEIQDPVGFNYSSPDPVYRDRAFRIVHGVNVGLGLFF